MMRSPGCFQLLNNNTKYPMIRYLILPFLGLLAAVCPAQSVTEPAAELGQIELCQADSSKKKKKRNVAREAQRKKKELREMGVKTVRVASPGDWPKGIPVPEETMLVSKGQQPGVGFIYETNNYRFHSPVAIEEDAQRTIGRLFECAFAANKAVGEVLPVPRTTMDRTEKKYLVELWPTKQQYIQKGGPADSAGVFTCMFRRAAGSSSDSPGPLREEDIAGDKVMVPFESLGLGSNGSIVSRDIDTHVLVHELTHQNFVRNGLPIWANEGWAEYLGYVPYMGETLDFGRCFSMITHAAKEKAPHGALDFPFTLADFLTMSKETMYGYMAQGKDTYQLAVMTIAFFVHLDGRKGVDAIKAYMQALLDGTPNVDAVEELIKPHRNAKNLQKDFIRAWKRKKVDVSFADEK